MDSWISFYVDSLSVQNHTIISFVLLSLLSPQSLQGLGISEGYTQPKKVQLKLTNSFKNIRVEVEDDRKTDY